MNFINKIIEFFIYFFRSTPEGRDLTKFGRTHLILLSIAYIGGILIYVFRDQLKTKHKFILKIFIVFLFFQQLILYLWYIFSGSFSWGASLPLYDCRIAILCLIYGVFTNSDKYKRYGIYLGFIGSIVAILTPDLDRFIFPHYTWFSFFVGHILLLWVSCYIFFVEEIEISFYKYKEVFIFTNVFHLIVLVFNLIVHSNYAFLTEPPILKGIFSILPKPLYSFVMLLILNLGLFIVHSYFMKSRKGVKIFSKTKEHHIV